MKNEDYNLTETRSNHRFVKLKTDILFNKTKVYLVSWYITFLVVVLFTKEVFGTENLFGTPVILRPKSYYQTTSTSIPKPTLELKSPIVIIISLFFTSFTTSSILRRDLQLLHLGYHILEHRPV